MAAGFDTHHAKVVQIPLPQLYGALRSGQVDAAENPTATILTSKFYEVQTYLTLTGHGYDPAVIIMSANAYAALSDSDKSAFVDAAKAAAHDCLRWI